MARSRIIKRQDCNRGITQQHGIKKQRKSHACKRSKKQQGKMSLNKEHTNNNSGIEKQRHGNRSKMQHGKRILKEQKQQHGNFL